MIAYNSIHSPENIIISFFLNSWILFQCINVLYFHCPFICWWIFRLFAISVYYEQRRNEHGWSRISAVWCRILWVYAWGYSCIIYQPSVYFQTFTLISRLVVPISSPTSYDYIFHFLIFTRDVPFFIFLFLAILTRTKWNLKVVLICISQLMLMLLVVCLESLFLVQ